MPLESVTYRAGHVSRENGTSTGQNPLSLRSREGDVPVPRFEEKEQITYRTLLGGLTVREDVIDWCISQELQGVRFSVKDGRIYPQPLDALTEADRAFLRTHRNHVLAVVTYDADAARKKAGWSW